jgi:hypothetical protein
MAVVGVGAFLVLSLVVLPSWPRGWWLALLQDNTDLVPPVLRPFGLVLLLVALFAVLVVGLSYQEFWADINGYGRTATPLVLLVAMRAVSGESLWTMAPCAMLDLRLSVQLGSQTWAALQGLIARLLHF